MAWIIEKRDYTDKEILDMVLRHRLVPSNPREAIDACLSLQSSKKYVVTNGTDSDVAKVFVNVSPSQCMASIDMIPTPAYFRSEEEYREDFRAVMAPLLRTLFGIKEMRRVTAYIPHSRGRTKKAFRSLGFEFEGRIQDGVLFRKAKNGPEDLFIMGMTPGKFEKEYGDGS